MSSALANCRHVPGWIKPFLAGVRSGYNDRNAAQLAGVGTAVVVKQLERDPIFKGQYEEAIAARPERPTR